MLITIKGINVLIGMEEFLFQNLLFFNKNKFLFNKEETKKSSKIYNPKCSIQNVISSSDIIILYQEEAAANLQHDGS